MHARSKHILILCSRLDLPGGTERVIANTANLLTSKGNKVSIFVLDENGSDKSFFPIDPSVSLFFYTLHFGITPNGNTITRKISFLNHLRLLRNRIKKLNPDVIINTEYSFVIATRLIAINRKTRILSWEHHHFNHLKRNRFWQALFNRVYPKIDQVICLNEDEAKFFRQIGCKTFVVPNFTSFSSEERSTLNEKRIITVGWFSKTKGVDFISAIAEKVFKKHPDWVWKVIGQGEEISALRNVSNLKLCEPILNIEEEYLNSSIYVLPSRFECFPMVLLEAMSFGVPCIAFDCPTGPGNIIRQNEDGILVERHNTEAMANAIMGLIENEEKRKEMGAKAFENIKRFSPEKVYELWEKLLNAE